MLLFRRPLLSAAFGEDAYIPGFFSQPAGGPRHAVTNESPVRGSTKSRPEAGAGPRNL